MLNFIDTIKNNPVYIKENIIQDRIKRRRRFPVPSWTGYPVVIFLPMLIILYSIIQARQSFDVKIFQGGFIISCYLQIFYFCYKAISYSFSLIVREKEQRTLESILNTTLSPQDIFKGKFFTAFCPLSYELTIFLPVFLLTGLITGVHLFKLMGVYILTMLLIIFSIILGLWTSSWAKNSQNSHSWASGIMAFIFFGSYLVFLVLLLIITGIFKFPMDNSKYYTLLETLLFINPFVSLSTILFIDSSTLSAISISNYILGILLCINLYVGTTVYFWKNTIKKLAYIPED